MASTITDKDIVATKPDGTPYALALLDSEDGNIIYADSYTELIPKLAEYGGDTELDYPEHDDTSDEANEKASTELYHFATRIAYNLQCHINNEALDSGFIGGDVAQAYEELNEVFVSTDPDVEVEGGGTAAMIAFITHPGRKSWTGDDAIIVPGGEWDMSELKLVVVAQNYLDNPGDLPRGEGVIVLDAENEKTFVDSLVSAGVFQLFTHDDSTPDPGVEFDE